MPYTQPSNTFDVSRNIEPNEEQVELVEDALSTSLTDGDFKASVTSQLSRAEAYWDGLRIKQRRSINFKYWSGDQVNPAELRDDLEKQVDNAIFRNIETLIPIVSARTPELTVTPTFKNEITRKFARDVGRMLPIEWETSTYNMQKLVGRGIRNHQMNFIAVYEYGYDPDTQELWTEEIVATDMVISKHGDFVARYIKNETIGDILDKFDDKAKEIRDYFKLGQGDLTKKVLDSPAEYLQVWTDDMVGWKLGDLVLGKAKNPHFDYTGKEIDYNGKKVLVKYNHFKAPKKPLLFITYFNRGIHIMDDTTLIEQAIGPQDWINKRKRQIGANADSTNGHWVSSGDYISKEEFDKITGGIDEKIWLANGMPADGLMKITGQPLPDYIYNDLLDSRGVIDNLMGTHATTRGESSGNSTATQDIMQKDQDYGRVDGYIRDGVEVFAKDWYEAMYHMMLVYCTDDKSIAIPEDDDFETDNVIFSQDRVPLIQKNDGSVIPVPLLFKVKAGSTLPKDEVSEYMRAKEMKDVLNPMDYLKMVGVHNPKELYKNSLIHQMDPMFFFKDDKEVQELLMKKQQEAQMQAQAQAEQQMAMEQQKSALKVQEKAQTTQESAPIEAQEAQGVANAMAAIIQEQE